jgi:hypothetical protein
MRQVKTTVDLEKEDHYEKIIGSYLPGIRCLRPGTNHHHFSLTRIGHHGSTVEHRNQKCFAQ